MLAEDLAGRRISATLGQLARRPTQDDRAEFAPQLSPARTSSSQTPEADAALRTWRAEPETELPAPRALYQKSTRQNVITQSEAHDFKMSGLFVSLQQWHRQSEKVPSPTPPRRAAANPVARVRDLPHTRRSAGRLFVVACRDHESCRAASDMPPRPRRARTVASPELRLESEPRGRRAPAYEDVAEARLESLLPSQEHLHFT